MVDIEDMVEVKENLVKQKTTESNRVLTGIPGLDEMIEGGFKRGSTILVVGGCGSGKSTFCMQYLQSGAKSGEPGVYVTFEEYPEEMRDNFRRYDWGLDELEKQGKLRIMRIEPREVLNVIKEDYGTIVDAINDIKAERVIIDSISTIELMVRDPYEKREGVLKLCEWLRRHDCTSLITSEIEQQPMGYSRQGIVEFIVDGVIVLYNTSEGNIRHNAVEVLKMRGTRHAKKIVPFMIHTKKTPPIIRAKGVNIFPTEQLFSKSF